jgi:hypothetical protein
MVIITVNRKTEYDSKASISDLYGSFNPYDTFAKLKNNLTIENQ